MDEKHVLYRRRHRQCGEELPRRLGQARPGPGDGGGGGIIHRTPAADGGGIVVAHQADGALRHEGGDALGDGFGIGTIAHHVAEHDEAIDLEALQRGARNVRRRLRILRGEIHKQLAVKRHCLLMHFEGLLAAAERAVSSAPRRRSTPTAAPRCSKRWWGPSDDCGAG